MMDRTDITPLRGYPCHAPTELPISRSYGATHITLLRGYYYPYHAPTELPAQRSYGATHITSRWDCSFFDRNLLP